MMHKAAGRGEQEIECFCLWNFEDPVSGRVISLSKLPSRDLRAAIFKYKISVKELDY